MVKIFVVTHKENPLLQNELYQPIQVNSIKNPPIYDGILTDSISDNIALKNENYCELTASYWLSKNYPKTEYIGLCHYRRYFNFYKNPLSFKPSTQKKISSNNFKKTKLFRTPPKKQEKYIIDILKKYDVILPLHYSLGVDKRKISLSENYAINHRKEDFDITKQIILEKYPEYKNSIHTYLEQSPVFFIANMLITSKKIWDDYHNWLFDILFELEKRIEIPKDDYQKRIFGFISERLTALYFQHHNFKIKEIPLYKIV